MANCALLLTVLEASWAFSLAQIASPFASHSACVNGLPPASLTVVAGVVVGGGLVDEVAVVFVAAVAAALVAVVDLDELPHPEIASANAASASAARCACNTVVIPPRGLVELVLVE